MASVRRLVVVSVVVGVVLVARSFVAAILVTFQAPHGARQAMASLDRELSRAVETQIDEAKIESLDELVELSLGMTGERLRFGLGHKTSLAFGSKVREGNCIEYAHLFATVFNRAADRKRIAARAYVVHSDARVVGLRLPVRGLDDHDWVMVVPTAGGARPLFVDPTFHDLGLGWDISRSVSGDVRAPPARPRVAPAG